MLKFLYTFSLILAGLSLGYSTQQLIRKQMIRLPIPLDQLRKILMQVGLLFIMPVTIVGAVWIIKIKDLQIITLPFLGVFAISLGGFLALFASRLFQLERRKAGSLIPCGSFTNIGTIGGLICYVFLGEMGFALVPLYKLFEELTYYTVGFPIAKLYSAERVDNEPFLTRLKRVVTDIFIIVSLASITLGGLLNLSGMERPAFYETVNSLFIPLAAFVLITAIGLAMKIEKVKGYLRECITVSLIKFLCVPVIVTSTGFLLGYGNLEEGLLLKVVLILSSMPVAFIALVPPTLYNLDIDLANSCWLFTTGLLIIVLPALYFLIRLF